MYRCILCPTVFSTLVEMKRHISIFHSTEEVYYCKQGTPNCQRSFPSLRALYRHIEASHVLPVIAIPKANNVEPQDHEICDSPNSANPCALYESDVDLDELKFVVAIFSEPTLQRKNADKIVNLTKNLLSKKFNAGTSFDNLSTESQRIAALKGAKLWLEPYPVVLDYCEEIVGEEIVTRAIKATSYDLKDMCSIIFSVPSIMNAAKDYLKKPRSSTLKDFKDGYLLENSPANTIPFVLFFDELEVGNALGSHKGASKLGMIYLSFRCF